MTGAAWSLLYHPYQCDMCRCADMRMPALQACLPVYKATTAAPCPKSDFTPWRGTCSQLRNMRAFVRSDQRSTFLVPSPQSFLPLAAQKRTLLAHNRGQRKRAMVVGRRGKEVREFQGRELVQQQGCLVASRFPSPACPPFPCVEVLHSVHQPGKASTEMRAPLYPFPRASPAARTESTEPRFVVARRAVCEIQTTSSPPLDSIISTRDDVTRTEIWIIGARPSLPRLPPRFGLPVSLCLDLPSVLITSPAPCCCYLRRPLQPSPAPTSPAV